MRGKAYECSKGPWVASKLSERLNRWAWRAEEPCRPTVSNDQTVDVVSKIGALLWMKLSDVYHPEGCCLRIFGNILIEIWNFDWPYYHRWWNFDTSYDTRYQTAKQDLETSVESAPKKARGKVMVTVFWDNKRVAITRGHSKHNRYSQILKKFCLTIKRFLLSGKMLFQRKDLLKHFKWEVYHPPFPPDFASSDQYMFLQLKKNRGRSAL